MNIKKGNDRIVLIFPNLVIKIARINFRGIKNVLKFICYPRIKQFEWRQMFLRGYYFLFVYGVDAAGSTTSNFKGIRDNLGEFIFFWKEYNPFLQPTYFSLFGLVNIQKTAHHLNEEDLWRKFAELDANDMIFEVGAEHTFNSPANFCWDKKGFLKILDYGSPRAKRVVAKYGDIFHQIHKSSIIK